MAWVTINTDGWLRHVEAGNNSYTLVCMHCKRRVPFLKEWETVLAIRWCRGCHAGDCPEVA